MTSEDSARLELPRSVTRSGAEPGSALHGRWDPQQYLRFREQRAQPFYDLAAMVERRETMRIVDLGCGPGELTAWLHRELGAASTLGVDLSEEMLAEAAAHAGDGVSFERAHITEFATEHAGARFDLVYSNAALQWVDDHEDLLPRLRAMLAPGGQIAIQIPSRATTSVGPILGSIVAREPYASALSGFQRSTATQSPDWYATAFYRMGADEQRVELRVYGHVLPTPLDVVEWFKGSALTTYRSLLPGDLYDRLVADYEREVMDVCRDEVPYFLPFNRILMWARFP